MKKLDQATQDVALIELISMKISRLQKEKRQAYGDKQEETKLKEKIQKLRKEKYNILNSYEEYFNGITKED